MNRNIFVMVSALVIGLTLTGCVPDAPMKKGFVEKIQPDQVESGERNSDS